jgi:hypothetical protein
MTIFNILSCLDVEKLEAIQNIQKPSVHSQKVGTDLISEHKKISRETVPLRSCLLFLLRCPLIYGRDRIMSVQINLNERGKEASVALISFISVNLPLSSDDFLTFFCQGTS